MRTIEKSGKTQKSYKEKSKERSEKMTEGLQEELDALVLPVSVMREHQREKGKVQVVKKPVEKEHILSKETKKEDPVKSVKKKVNPWGIVIGETD